MPRKRDPRSQYLRSLASDDRTEAATEPFSDRDLLIAAYHAVKAWLRDPLIDGMPPNVTAEQAATVAGQALHVILTRRSAPPTDDELLRGAFALNSITTQADPFDMSNYGIHP